MLAPRIVHFGDSELFWECHEQQASESFPQGVPEIVARSSGIGKSLDPVVMQKRYPEYSVVHAGYVVWDSLLRFYTSRGANQSRR
jgi:hypothetical protein